MEVLVKWRSVMYVFSGNVLSVHWHCPLNSRCLLFRVSVNRGSTVLLWQNLSFEVGNPRTNFQF